MLDDGRQAQIDALRVTLGTVPGTVRRAVLEGVSGPVFGAILQPVRTANPTATWRAYRMSTDGLTDRLTPAVSCRLTGRTTSISVRRATRRRTWTGTCEMNLTGSVGSPSPKTVGCPDAVRGVAWLVTARAPSGPLRQGRRNQQRQQARMKDEG